MLLQRFRLERHLSFILFDNIVEVGLVAIKKCFSAWMILKEIMIID